MNRQFAHIVHGCILMWRGLEHFVEIQLRAWWREILRYRLLNYKTQASKNMKKANAYKVCASVFYGGTTLNQLPIGLHVKILNFNGRFEAYWATFGMLSWYQ